MTSSHISPSSPDIRSDSNPSSSEIADVQEELESTIETPHLSGHSHPHVHNPEAQRKLINRLARIEGHVHGIRSMIEHNEPCPDVLLQIAAVRGALDRVARLILDDHISHCITHAASTGHIETELDDLKKALDRFIK